MKTVISEKYKLGIFPVIIGIFLFVIMSASVVQGAVLSIDQATIRSNYFGFDEAWIVSMVSDDYTTDYITAYLSPQAIEDASGQEAKQGLNIQVSTKPNYCTYSFKTNTFNYQDVYTVEPIKITKWLWTQSDLNELKDTVESNCADFSKTNYKAQITDVNSDGSVWTAGDYVYGTSSWVFQAEVFCVKLNEKVGTIAQPIDKKIIAETDWTVGADGKTPESKTISNSDAGSGRSTQLGSNIWIQWQGNLGTGEDCPDVSNLIGIHDNSFSNGWKLGSRDDYNTYSSYLTNGIKNDIREYAESSYPEDYASLFKDRANLIMRDVVDEEVGFSYSVLDTSYASGKVKIDLGRQIVFPLFRLIIDADYLELNIPTGIPAIDSVSDVKFTEGLSGQMTAVIRNAGDSQGGFTSRVVSCTNGFSSSTSPIGSTLTAGATKTLYFNIIGSSTDIQQTVNGVCTLEVKESITGQTATRIFGIKMEQIQQCTPGSTACSLNNDGKDVIKKCNTAGTQYEITEVCPDTQECRLTTTGAKCVDKEDEGGSFGYCEDCDAYAKNLIFGKIFKSTECMSKTFQNGFFCIGAILRLFAIPLFFILGLLFSLQTIGRFMKGEYKALTWLLSIILAFLVALLTYLIFYVGLVIIIIIFIVRIAINFIPGVNMVRKLK